MPGAGIFERGLGTPRKRGAAGALFFCFLRPLDVCRGGRLVGIIVTGNVLQDGDALWGAAFGIVSR